MTLRNRKNRPLHLGPYPLESIKRRDDPTTLIVEDEVQRVPKRGDGFERARHGDYGPRLKELREQAGGVQKGGNQPPLYAVLGELLRAMGPMHDGPVADEKAPDTDDPEAMARHLKSFGYFMDADAIGICEAKPYAWYSHRRDGSAVEVEHKYAIVILVDQGYDTMEGSSGDDWMSSAQSSRGYMRGAEIGNALAMYIRKLGYPARCHSPIEGDVMHLPLMLWAGLGELSRIGEVVINPFLGPRFKSTVVTTDLPMALDKPIDFGLQDFCEKCMKCARECPVSAIPFGDKVMYNGYETWKPDVQNCTGYRISNPRGLGCGRCMKMCPWNKVDFPLHKLGRWLAIHAPWSRRFLARLDDWLGFGNRNPLKKWWFDFTVKEGRIAVADDVNARDNHPDKQAPANHRMALYTPETLPPSVHPEPFPFDRREGVKTAAAMETPAAARMRVAGKDGAGPSSGRSS